MAVTRFERNDGSSLMPLIGGRVALIDTDGFGNLFVTVDNDGQRFVVMTSVGEDRDEPYVAFTVEAR
jgi:hypothetical protein